MLMLLSVCITSIMAIAYVGYNNGRQALNDSIENQLVSLRENKAYEIENYFQTVSSQVQIISQVGSIVEAIEDFKIAYRELNEKYWILTDLARCASSRCFGVGEQAIAQGQNSEEFYIITSGEASVTIAREDSERKWEIARLSVGDFFGESGLSGKNINPVTITALSDLKLLVLPIENMQLALEQSTRLRQEIGAVMESRRKAIARVRRSYNIGANNGNGRYSQLS